MKRHLLFASLLCLSTAGCDRSGPAPEQVVDSSAETAPAAAAQTTVETPRAETKELEWDALIPPDWRPEALMAEYDASDLADDDPRAQDIMDKLRALWDQAPVVSELDGAAVRLPGFVVPLQSDGETVEEFLLVPYYGACVHVPPPPANQTVYVVTEQGKGTRQKLFDTVWVNGTLGVKQVDSEAGVAGYILYASEVTPYE